MIVTTPPKLWADHAVVRDRIIINWSALLAWLRDAFGITTRAAALARWTDFDPLAERITIDEVDYQIPHDCYYSLGFEPGDTRPRKV